MSIIDDSLAIMMKNGVPIIQRADWDIMTVEERQSLGKIILQESSTGYVLGKYLDAEKSLYPPVIINASSRNASTQGTLTYTFSQPGVYQILGIHAQATGVFGTNGAYFELDGQQISHTYSQPAGVAGNNIGVEMYVTEVNITTANSQISFTNTATSSNSGIELFILQNVRIEDIQMYGSRSNAESTFYIGVSENQYYLYVTDTGYYYSQNNFGFYEINNVQKQTKNPNMYYGVCFVIIIQNNA